MPIPNPKGSEAKKKFVTRCMGDNVMTKEFPDGKQRAAVCYSKWKKRPKHQSRPNGKLKTRTLRSFFIRYFGNKPRFFYNN